MKYKLIAPVSQPSAVTQVLLNRGIDNNKIRDYTLVSDKDINPPEAFGEERLKEAVQMVAQNIKNNSKTIIIVDPDVDGNTSSALLLNFLYDLFPDWTKNIKIYFHTGKQHGLGDCKDYILENKYQFVLCPDAGSNDTDVCKELSENGVEVLILDHHDLDKNTSFNEYALIINNQDGYSNYPNKALSGVGVVWQFCRYFDKIIQTEFANDYLDLVAVGLVADMMDIRSFETKALIKKGLTNLRNPYLYLLAQKNAFKLGSQITPIGAAFYIVPLLNAVQRSGTLEEKELVFNSMLKYKAFEQVPSTKRGHKLGEMEKLVEQAVRTSTNVKNRQTRVQDASLEALEKKIENEHLLDHKVLLLLLDDDNIPAEVRGLIANKFMAKYQRPCCLLTKGEEYSGQTIDGYRYETVYNGSARGCSLAGVVDFKQLCLDTGKIGMAVGHPNAFGLKLYEQDIEDFIAKTDEMLKDMSDEAIYYVDYIFEGQNCNPQIILDIADMSDYWGTELDEALVAVNKLKVTKDMVDIYRKTTNTIKISLNNGVSIMKFDADEELCDKLTTNNTGYIELDIVGKCNKNEWNGNITPQIFVEDYNIIDSSKYYF